MENSSFASVRGGKRGNTGRKVLCSFKVPTFSRVRAKKRGFLLLLLLRSLQIKKGIFFFSCFPSQKEDRKGSSRQQFLFCSS